MFTIYVYIKYKKGFKKSINIFGKYRSFKIFKMYET